MNISEESEHEVLALKEELIPNFNLLDHQVQVELINILDTILAQPPKKTIQELSRQGVLEEAPLLRAHVWKLLLETLPPNPALWHHTKTHNHELYKTLTSKFAGGYLDEDDLLSMHQQVDSALWNEIELDTRRTHSTFHFFQKEVDHCRLYLGRPTRNSDLLGRILYIWGRLNPTVKYVQGMNQILAPLYYLEFQWPHPMAESEVFFMFSGLMTFLIDMHIKDMDESEQGIMGRMRYLNRFLKVVDYELWLKLQHEKIIPQYYSFRWMALMLAQEFGLYETIKLWDVMLSYDGSRRYFYLYCCCVAILKYRKSTIMQNDFVQILPLIQKLRDVNVGRIVEIANRLYEKYSKVNIDKLHAKLNQQLQQRKNKPEEPPNQAGEGKRWTYSNMIEKTGNFLSKMVGRK